jgi:hypothetical protein
MPLLKELLTSFFIKYPSYILDLLSFQQTSKIVRKVQMNLNPVKCTFRVSSGMLIGFVVSEQRIEANPEKIKAVLEMKPL